MRIVADKTLRSFWESHADSEEQFRLWIKDARAAKWQTPHEIKAMFASASILTNNRVCFNIKGNDYRLIVSVNYEKETLYIKWVGTHAEYSKIDAEKVGFKKGGVNG